MQVAQGAVKPDKIPDLYWFRVSSLHSLSDLHGENSTTLKRAKELLGAALQKLSDSFQQAYKGRVFSSVISSDTAHTRRIRAAEDDEDTTDRVIKSFLTILLKSRY